MEMGTEMRFPMITTFAMVSTTTGDGRHIGFVEKKLGEEERPGADSKAKAAKAQPAKARKGGQARGQPVSATVSLCLCCRLCFYHTFIFSSFAARRECVHADIWPYI